MENEQQHEDGKENVEEFCRGLVYAKDLALVIEDQLHALSEYEQAQEVVGRTIGALNVHIQHLDRLIERADMIAHH